MFVSWGGQEEEGAFQAELRAHFEREPVGSCTIRPNINAGCGNSSRRSIRVSRCRIVIRRVWRR